MEKLKKMAGIISYKTGEDGTEEPYEINITWFSALNSEDGDEDIPFQIKRFVASRGYSACASRRTRHIPAWLDRHSERCRVCPGHRFKPRDKSYND